MIFKASKNDLYYYKNHFYRWFKIKTLNFNHLLESTLSSSTVNHYRLNAVSYSVRINANVATACAIMSVLPSEYILISAVAKFLPAFKILVCTIIA